MTAAEARAAVGAPDSMRVAVVDASGIALATIKKDMPNTPIVGALAKITGLFPVEKVKERLVITFGKKFSPGNDRREPRLLSALTRRCKSNVQVPV